MSWYKVIGSEAVTYVDETGQKRRANVGTVINVERRSEAQALQKAGSIARYDGDAEASTITTQNFIQRDGDNAAQGDSEPAPRPSVPPNEKNAATGPETASIGSLVRYGNDVGEVKKVNPKTLDVQFADGDKPRRLNKEDVEVIG